MAALTAAACKQLARHLLDLCFDELSRSERPTLREVTAFTTTQLTHPISETELAMLDKLADEPDTTSIGGSRRTALLRAFAMPTVRRSWEHLPEDERRPEPLTPPTAVTTAAIRIAIDPKNADPEDTETLRRWGHTKGSTAVAHMDDYVAERRGLPTPFDTTTFVSEVTKRLQGFGGEVSGPFIAVVTGRLLLDGNTEPVRSDFRWAVKRAYDAGVTESPNTPGVTNKEHYANIVGDFKALRRDQRIKYQELAAVADHVIASSDEDWDITDRDSRRSQVEVGMIRYADGTVDTGFASLDLPAIVSEDASNQEIEPPNVECVAMIGAAYEIEQTGAFDVVDKMVELFTQGMLPVRDDSGGRALNRYFWQTETRLDAAARAGLYARALGRGDTGNTDAQPNTQFEQLMMRFVSALVRYDSTLQVSNVVTTDGRDRLGSSEQVRKAAQDFAANASLVGWGFTVFAARKLSQHIDCVFDVLGQETLQRAYGVTGPWQLVERVSAVELGSTPSIVQHRTRAQAIKDILDLLAVYSTELCRSGGVRRFLPNIDDLRGSGSEGGASSTVSVVDYEKLVSAANNLLAVGGVTDDEIARFSAPVASSARGSIPTVGGDVGGSNGTANLDQIRQLAQQGQFAQLQQLLGAGTGSFG
ncbi:hypothetical protein [Nocardioides sp. URHA0020]|uniref:hypothetical protein n=1 Tax=Nocardioides sp. URHA0020 TaxID=1380392 RepID=UPI000491A2B1|nr:hypothetical protein [Nocardioides sp. URHA0020]